MRRLRLLGSIAVAVALARAAEPGEFFEMKVRPVLAKNCYACHTDSRMGGLRLDSAEARQGRQVRPAIVPGKPDESLLVQAIRQTHERLKMPPGGQAEGRRDRGHRGLGEGRRGLAEAGASAERQAPTYVITPQQRAFWAFQPVRKPAVPQVKNMPCGAKSRSTISSWPSSKSKGLKPARPADKRVLIRRATFDLTGLPPTPEEVDAFLRDKSPDAFAKVVDRLLASPRYGERWGRYWLDVARYSDDKLNSTQDEPYPNAFRYRDWVIQAFNRRHAVRPVRQGADRGRPAAVRRSAAVPAGPRFLRAESGDAGRARGCHHARLPRPDGGLRAVPRPQVRSDSAEGLLLAAGRLLQLRVARGSARAEGRGGEVGRAKRRRSTSWKRS